MAASNKQQQQQQKTLQNGLFLKNAQNSSGGLCSFVFQHSDSFSIFLYRRWLATANSFVPFLWANFLYFADADISRLVSSFSYSRTLFSWRCFFLLRHEHDFQIKSVSKACHSYLLPTRMCVCVNKKVEEKKMKNGRKADHKHCRIYKRRCTLQKGSKIVCTFVRSSVRPSDDPKCL